MADDRARTRDTLLRQLVADALPSGGWPYYAGKSARIEPTTWALLALQSAPDAAARRRLIADGLAWLRSLQREDGLLVEPATKDANYAWNGLVLAATQSLAIRDLPFEERLVKALLQAKGVRLEGDPKVIRQDSTLQAWSWIAGTFSWIEPTAYCLIAMKKRTSRTPEMTLRIAEAEAVLFDRMCGGGGWNYGNAQVLSQDLRAYVPTTAVALLALADRPTQAAVAQSLEWLIAHQGSERSGMALSLAAVALSAFGKPIEPLLDALVDQHARTGFLGNLHLGAMAVYALGLPTSRSHALLVREGTA
jgi:hypothetical protein